MPVYVSLSALCAIAHTCDCAYMSGDYDVCYALSASATLSLPAPPPGRAAGATIGGAAARPTAGAQRGGAGVRRAQRAPTPQDSRTISQSTAVPRAPGVLV